MTPFDAMMWRTMVAKALAIKDQYWAPNNERCEKHCKDHNTGQYKRRIDQSAVRFRLELMMRKRLGVFRREGYDNILNSILTLYQSYAIKKLKIHLSPTLRCILQLRICGLQWVFFNGVKMSN